MSAKTDHKKASQRLQAEQIIKNFKKRGMDGIFCATGAQVGEALGY